MAASLRIVLDETSYSVANNTSTVSAVVQIAGNGVSWNNYQCAGRLYVNGNSYSFTHTFTTSTSWQTLYTVTGITVPHNSDGSKTISATASFATGVSIGTLTASNSLTLTKIARKSTCTVDVQRPEYGSNVVFTITAQSTGFTHDVYLGRTGYMDYVQIFTNVAAGNHTFTIPEEYAQYFTTTDNELWLKLVTKYGSTTIGTTEYKPILYIQPSADMSPVVTVSCTDATPNYALYGGYVQAQSELQIQHNIAYSYNATGVARIISVNDSTYTAATDNTITQSSALQRLLNTVTVSVTDSRGSVGQTSVDIEAIPWYQPKKVAFTIERCSDAAGTTPDNEGTYLHVQYSVDFAPVNSQNEKSLTLTYKKESDTEYTSVTIPTTTYTPQGSLVLPDFLATNSYNIQLISTDSFGTYVTAFTILPAAAFKFHLNASGKAFAIGKASKYTETIEIARDLIYYNKVYAVDSTNVVQPLFYKSGDTIASQYLGTGYITTTGTQYIFTIPITKPIIGNTITVNSMTATVVQNNQYLLGAHNSPIDIASAEVTITASGIQVKYTAVTAPATYTNNDTIGVSCSYNITIV